MPENIKKLFTEAEWTLLKEKQPTLCEQMQTLPLHIKISSEGMDNDNE